jgi:hypothetical protein
VEGRRDGDSNWLDELHPTSAMRGGGSRGVGHHTRGGVDRDHMRSFRWGCGIRGVPEEISPTGWTRCFLRRGRRGRSRAGLNLLKLLHTCSNKDSPEDTPNQREEGLRDVSNAFEAIGKGTFLNQIIATDAMLITDEISGNAKVHTTASHCPRHFHGLLHHVTDGTRHTEEGIKTISK